MRWTFRAEVFQWRGPAPYYFAETPAEVDAYLHDRSTELSYGWGVIPARVRVGETEIVTSLMPRRDVYLVPLKVALRRATGMDDGDVVELTLTVDG